MRSLPVIIIVLMFCLQTVKANEPDSVYLFSYATDKNNNHNGLHFAWSRDQKNWLSIGNEMGFLYSDYGKWGSEKRMITPFLIQGADGTWQCVWSLNDRELLFAHASSPDLVNWGRQSYPLMKQGKNCLKPMIEYDKNQRIYIITYTDADGKYFSTTTKDCKSFTAAVPVSAYKNTSTTIMLPAGQVSGQLHHVPYAVVSKLITEYQVQQYKGNLYRETTKLDSFRFADLTQ